MNKDRPKRRTVADLDRALKALTDRVATLERGYKMDHIVFGTPFHPSESGDFTPTDKDPNP